MCTFLPFDLALIESFARRFTPVTYLKTVFFCVPLCLVVQDNKTLQELNIGWNKIGPEGASSLAKALTVLAHSMAYLFGFFLRFAKRLFVLV